MRNTRKRRRRSTLVLLAAGATATTTPSSPTTCRRSNRRRWIDLLRVLPLLPPVASCAGLASFALLSPRSNGRRRFPSQFLAQPRSFSRVSASSSSSSSSGIDGAGQRRHRQPDEDGIGIGIDLGTTFSAAAVLNGLGLPEIVPVPPNGSRTIPSVVTFRGSYDRGNGEERQQQLELPLLPPNKVLVGLEARDDDDGNGDENDGATGVTFRHVKRVIGTGGKVPKDVVDVVPHVRVNRDGKTYKRDSLANQVDDAQRYPTMLELIRGDDGDGGDDDSNNNRQIRELIRPEWVSSYVLRTLKDAAEGHTGKRVDRAVIGVPAYFHDEQRAATVRAAELAGIPKVKLLREPEAAALAYGVGREQLRSKDRIGIDDDDVDDELVLVFDLGGGTYDVSILMAGGGVTEIISTSGNVNLGGTNFDRRIANHLLGLLKSHSMGTASWKKSGGVTDEDVTNAVLQVSEHIRIYLSNNKYANLALPLDPASWTAIANNAGKSTSVILPNDFTCSSKSDSTDEGLSPPEYGMSNSTHVLCRLSRRTFENLCRDEFQMLLRPIREVAIMAGALLPGDASPTAVDAALEFESYDGQEDIAFDDFYTDDENRMQQQDDIADDSNLLLELQQAQLELDMKRVKRAQQKGRKRARNVAKSERKYRTEKRKLQDPGALPPSNSQDGPGGRKGGTKIRDGITGRPISRVVLVGGATRMPAVGRLLAALTGVVPQRTVNPDEAVALGCAVHVGVLDDGAKSMTVLNPMQAAILRAVAQQQGLVSSGGDEPIEDGGDGFDAIEYY